MSVFGTTMTAFALVGSTGKSFERGIGTYGLMASISGLVHAAIFFLVGIRLWAFGKKHGYITQIQFFVLGSNRKALDTCFSYSRAFGRALPADWNHWSRQDRSRPVTAGAFPEIFTNPSSPAWLGEFPHG